MHLYFRKQVKVHFLCKFPTSYSFWCNKLRSQLVQQGKAEEENRRSSKILLWHAFSAQLFYATKETKLNAIEIAPKSLRTILRRCSLKKYSFLIVIGCYIFSDELRQFWSKIAREIGQKLVKDWLKIARRLLEDCSKIARRLLED